jgi:hypothetical protein
MPTRPAENTCASVSVRVGGSTPCNGENRQARRLLCQSVYARVPMRGVDGCPRVCAARGGVGVGVGSGMHVIVFEQPVSVKNV